MRWRWREFFRRGLAAAQKVEGGVELVLVDLAQAEHGAERVGGGRLAELARGRELGGRLDDPRHDHGHDQLGPALRSVRQHLVEPEPAHRPEHGGDVAMRQRTGDLEALGGERHKVSPASTRRRLSIFASGQSEMLASVRDLTLPPSR